jgi:hypothetical protein
MKPRLFLVALAAAVFCLGAADAPNVSMHDSAHVAPGEVHEGDVVVIMGEANIEGEVTGSVVVVLGNLRISGVVDQDVVAVMTDTQIASGAAIEGDLVNVGGSLQRAGEVRVEGESVNLDFSQFIPFSHGFDLSGLYRFLLILKLIRLAALFVILVLIAALIPRRLEVMAAAFPQQWGWAILVGIGAYAALVIGSIILVCTILGIPLALALVFVMLATKWIGLAATLYLVGHTAGRNLFGRDLSHLPSVLGGYVAYALLCMVPFFGFAFAAAMSILGVGLAIVTRYGSETPWRARPATVVPPPPAGVMPPPVIDPSRG